MQTRIDAELARLNLGATICPGELARRLEMTPSSLRPVLLEMADRGVVIVSQRGIPVDLRTTRGPFRVAPVRASR